jgi:hypothetical protein
MVSLRDSHIPIFSLFIGSDNLMIVREITKREMYITQATAGKKFFFFLQKKFLLQIGDPVVVSCHTEIVSLPKRDGKSYRCTKPQ